MAIAQAEDYVRNTYDDDNPEPEILEAAFIALYEREPDQEEQSMLYTNPTRTAALPPLKERSMLTLTLCESNHKFLCIQRTDEEGYLLGLDYLCGETCGSVSHEWEALAEVGEQEDQNDSDNFWRAVDTAIHWIAQHRGQHAGFSACREAYEGILQPKEIIETFREIMA